MTRLLIIFALFGALTLTASPATAHDAYDDSESHPLRMIAYIVHPVGVLAEWTISRPLHFMASQEGNERFFGHVPHENAFGDYRPYRNTVVPE